jgi:hypothetical protein
MKLPGYIDLNKFGIEVDKENEKITITKQGLATAAAYFMEKVEQTGLSKRNFYKFAFLTGKWQMAYNLLKLFSETDESEQPTTALEKLEEAAQQMVQRPPFTGLKMNNLGIHNDRLEMEVLEA